jgi:superfamily II DNA or RNA helicase
MTIRDERQKEFADVWLNEGRRGILNLCPRFGKIRTSINILKQLPKKSLTYTDATVSPSVLIAYPDNKIKESWQADFEELNYDDSNVTYTTHLSLKKLVGNEYDIIIIDEIHLLSEAQIEVCKELFDTNDQILGLTGTLSSWTERTLEEELDLHVLATYPIEKAIEEGVIVDYEIHVIRVPLDNKVLQDYKGKLKTEKKQFDSLTWVVNKIQRNRGDTMFMRLARMRVIQSSLAKRNATKALLTKHKDERVLVFCGVTKIADSLGIPSYHNKSKEKQMFEDFAEGKGNHLAVVKIGNTGVTYKPLDKVIINYFDSNAENLAQKIMRCTAFEYDNDSKKAQIYIISSDEPVEQKWLNKALDLFDKDKIFYL